MKDLDTIASEMADDFVRENYNKKAIAEEIFIAGFRAGHAHRDQQVDDLRHFVEVEEKLKLDAIDELAEAKDTLARILKESGKT